VSISAPSARGAHLLAEAGLLDGYKCTLHWENLPGFAEAFPEIDATGGLFEIDRDRFTSAGGTTALDMMLTLIASQHGPELASPSPRASCIRRSATTANTSACRLPARIGARHPKLVGIIEEMEENLEEPLSPSILAKQAGLSTRQLERLFRRYLDRSPKRYYLELRLKKARSLLLQTDMSVINVALACGFSSPSHFSKCYRAFYGRTPYRERGIPVIDSATRRANSLQIEKGGSSLIRPSTCEFATGGILRTSRVRIHLRAIVFTVSLPRTAIAIPT
jgi:AraC family transcriptional regulator, glycine betaine-responsive activator